MRLWESLKNYEKMDCKFRSWLSQVTRNTVLNYLDKQQRQDKRQSQMGEFQDMQLKLNSYGDGELERLIENEWRAYVSTIALENIRKLFSGVAVEAFLLSQKEVSGDDIARELGIKKDSAYVLISRVKSKFIAEMKRLIHEMEV